MRTLLYAALLIFATLFFLVLYLRADRTQAYLVCDGRCLKSLSFSDHAQLLVPMVNGKPDYKEARLEGVIVDVDHTLERVDLR